jgi:ribosomal protein L34E
MTENIKICFPPHVPVKIYLDIFQSLPRNNLRVFKKTPSGNFWRKFFKKFFPPKWLIRGIFMREVDCAHRKTLKTPPRPWNIVGIPTCLEGVFKSFRDLEKKIFGRKNFRQKMTKWMFFGTPCIAARLAAKKWCKIIGQYQLKLPCSKLQICIIKVVI